MGTKTQKLSNVVDQIVEWQSVITADGSTNTTAVAGRGYFIDTSSGAHTINLPASPKQGDVIKVSIITAGNTLTIGRNGNNINGSAADLTASVDGDAYELVYVNASEGWKSVGQIVGGSFISATGGTVTTSGDFKIHSFTGDGCFVVSSIGNADINPAGGPSTVDYLVVAGGGGSGAVTPASPAAGTGGGGAGGFRESKDSTVSSPHTASPLAATTGLTITATTYPVTVGAGGGDGPGAGGATGDNGSNSVFSTITSTGGGGGSNFPGPGANGGSGGGGRGEVPGGSGNTPPTSPPQGQNGGTGADVGTGGGGGGATAAGTAGTPSGSTLAAGPGGNGATTSISGSSTAYAGGGGGSAGPGASPSAGGTGGTGGGGNGGCASTPGQNGTTNTGGGAGGGISTGVTNPGHSGGKGIVIIRYKYQ